MASATATGKGAGRRSLNMVLFYVFLVIFVFVSIFPLLWVFKMSIVTKANSTLRHQRYCHRTSAVPSGLRSWATRRSSRRS